MKIKVKGLVFVGFAAAILSANAMATGEGTTITSLAYTDATYQQKTAASHSGDILYMQSDTAGDVGYKGVLTDESMANVNTGTDEAGTNDAKIPTARAVKGYVDGAITNASYSDFTGTDGTQAGAAGLVPAPATTDANKVLGSSGDWIGAFGAATANDPGSVGLVPAPAAGDQAKVLNGSGQWVPLPTVNNATLTVQLNGTSKGTFTANASSPATININGVEVTDNKLNGDSGNTIAANSTDTDKYPSAKAVYDFVTSQPSAGIPGKSSLCTAALPCALVAETTGFHWRVMAVSNDNTIQTTAAGTLADSCTKNTDCTVGTCNTTNHVCVE